MFAHYRALGLCSAVRAGTHNLRQVFTQAFTELRTIVDARYFAHSRFASRSVQLRGFAAKFRSTVEDDREFSEYDSARTISSLSQNSTSRGAFRLLQGEVRA